MKNIEIIGAQMDKGAVLRGVDMGPSAIRYAGLHRMIKELGFNVYDTGDITTSELQAEESPNNQNIHIINEINWELYKRVLAALDRRGFPLILGGDHSIAAGSATAMQKYYGNIGIIWVDAHGDFNNSKSSPSGNIHGMPLSAITGNGPDEILPFKEKESSHISPKNTVIIGARSIDKPERELIKKAGISVFTIADIDRHGMYEVIKNAVAIAGEGTEGIQLSFDLDAIDPSVAPGVGTPVNGGLTFREAHLLCEFLAASNKLIGIEVVELNPILDIGNQTGEVAAQLIASLLSKTIL
ncbi:MAG: arginase [Treponema sp.]|nr:arginase [Treponema sp.]